ncbi:MAG: hypothetical protein ILO36_03720, partial [Abditibacteriota bacterium]|nr:hypothetical protein [Abditibacteriota bacterium]
RTKRGNNNTWCRDDELSSFPWEQVKARRDTLHLTKRLIALRKAFPFAEKGHILWHGTEPGKPDHSWTSHTLAWEYPTVPSEENGYAARVYAAANMYSEPLAFTLPRGRWRLQFSARGPESGEEVSGSIECPPGSVFILSK